jgi:hypothetical protein
MKKRNYPCPLCGSNSRFAGIKIIYKKGKYILTKVYRCRNKKCVDKNLNKAEFIIENGKAILLDSSW